MLRQIVKIDEALCDGCGACVIPCAEGAIQIVNGKAKVTQEELCDGAGFCLGVCPRGALTIEPREAPDFDETAVQHVAPVYIQQRCFRCRSSEEARPLFPVRHQGKSLWVCAGCLPHLIHGAHS